MSIARRAIPELTSLALVGVTVFVGVLVAPALPEHIIVGWHVGVDGRVSVTRGPRLIGLVAIPAVTVGAYVALRITRVAVDGHTAADLRCYEVLAHLVLGTLAIGQAALLTVNL